MKTLLFGLLLLSAQLGFAQCTPNLNENCTPNLNLHLPLHGAFQNNWDVPINANTALIDQIFGGNVPVPNFAVSRSFTFTNAGVFTNTQMNLYVQSRLNGCDPFTEYQAAQGANTTTEAVTGCIAVPVSSTVHQADGAGFYISNSSPLTNAVGIYSQCRLLVNGTTCWGANFVSRDTPGLSSGMTLYGNEIDVNPLNPTTSYNGVNGFLMNLNTTQTGTFPGNGAFYATSSAGALWFVGFQTGDAAAATAGLFGATCTVGNCGSQVLKFRGFNGGTLFTATIGSDSTGNVILTPAPGQTAKVGSNPVVQEVSGGTVDLTAQAANVATATLFTTTTAGLYRVSCYTIVTTAATTSSTLPSCQVFWIDKDNSTSQGLTVVGTSAGNALTTFGEGVAVISVKAATAIQWSTSSYATSGATSMQYAVHIRLEAM